MSIAEVSADLRYYLPPLLLLLALSVSCRGSSSPAPSPSPAATLTTAPYTPSGTPTSTPSPTRPSTDTSTPPPSPLPTDTSTPTPTFTLQPTAIFRLRLDAVFSPTGDVPFGQRAYSPDDAMFASEVQPRDNGKIGIFQQGTDTLLRVIDAGQPRNRLKGLAWSPDSKRIAVMFHLSTGGAILIFQAQTGNVTQNISIPEYYHFLVFAPDGTHLIASEYGSNDRAESIDLNAPRAICPTSSSPPPSGPMSRFQKGMSYTSWVPGGYCSAASDQSLQNLSATGTEWISLIVTGYHETIASTSVDWASSRTPSDSNLNHAISTAHKLGLRVMLKPHVDLLHDSANSRGQVGEAFTEKQWQTWFASYLAGILHYADLAQAQGVEQFCIGTELSALSTRDQDWRNLVQQVRQRFKGTVVYASNWGEERNIGWWDAVDYIGVDAYYPLADKPDPSVDELKAAWVQKGLCGPPSRPVPEIRQADSFHRNWVSECGRIDRGALGLFKECIGGPSSPGERLSSGNRDFQR